MNKYMMAKKYNFILENTDTLKKSHFGFSDYLIRTMTIEDFNNLEKDFYNLKSDFYDL